jgi:DNA-binding NarL/FixJ family response regulator
MLALESQSDPIANAAVSNVEAPQRELRVLVVDDHLAVRTGVMLLLDEQPDISVVDAVASAEAAMLSAEQETIDVAVIDYQLGSRSGLWLSRMLKRMDAPPRVVIYSAYCDGPLSVACVIAESDALVSKGDVGESLCDAVRGRTHLPSVRARLAEAMRRRLEPRDQVVFGMLVAGIEKREVAETLGMTDGELDSRLWAMLQKLEGLDPCTDGQELPHPGGRSADSGGPRRHGAPSLRRRW